ncbi:hypothetical protein B0A52_00499 [Exophiala mesophila]|uniref:Uncharacterized protein n=1 Tax=Exophiala mesophila TaxID=212818 RepID=A0A438NK94_EXOME|nr:hypothetical protein B0A52_00499 [Exophiala mesophila]
MLAASVAKLPSPLDRSRIFSVLSAEAVVENEHHKLKKAVDTIKDHKFMIHGRQFKLRETVIPDAILATTSATPPVPQGICKLPAELQDMIWASLEVPDRAILAMTSKSHAEAYNSLKKALITRPGDTFPTMRRLPRPTKITKVHRLKVLVRLRSWMPSNYRLCYSCVTFLDLAQSSRANGDWGGDQQLVSSGLATEAAMMRGPHCPLCVKRRHIRLAKDRRTYKAYTSAINKISLRS